MKKIIFLASILSLLYSCGNHKMNYEYIIVNKGQIDEQALHSLNEAEKALLCAYLFINGNACLSDTKNLKCQVLKKIGIADECASEHIAWLKQWFQNDLIISSKLNHCPCLPPTIRNSIQKIILSRRADTLSITFGVAGVNIAQEKNWEIEQKQKYIVNNYSFIKINGDGNKKD